MKNRLMVISILLVLVLVCTSCSNKKADYVDDGIANIDFGESSGSDTEESCVYGDFSYPDNPAESLRNHLEDDIVKRKLPLELGEIQRIAGSWQDTMEFKISFTNHDNACVVSFAMKSESAMDDYYSLDGKDNPTFTIAFKDPDNAEDMITVLTSVILYLSPDIGMQEAQRLAVKLDETLSIDGFSVPLDIGGYQVQTHYTNPETYFTTSEFSSSFGVSVRALKQIWKKEIDLSQCEKLSSENDFAVLMNPQSLLTDEFQMDASSSRVVYADFTVTEWWDYEEWVHGDPTTFVRAKSPYGTSYVLTLNPLQTPYDFGVGEKYTLVITYSHGDSQIIYAIQH